MKTTLVSVLWTLVTAVTFSACSSEKESYLSSLPADSSVALKLNLVQMTQKSNILNNPMAGILMMQLDSNVPEGLKAKYEEIKKDPGSAGIDLQQPLALSVGMKDLNNPQVVAVAALSDGAKFDELMQAIAASDQSVTIEKLAGGAQRINIQGNKEAELVYNDNRIVIASAGMDAAKLIAQTAAQSILGNPNFKDFAETRNDYSMFCDYAWLAEAVGKQQGNANLDMPALEWMKNTSVYFTVNFEQGKIVADSKIYAGDELTAFQQKFYVQPTGKFLGLLPADTWLAVNGGAKNMGEVFSLMGEKERKQIQQALQQYGLTEELFNSIEGDMTLGVFDEGNPQGIPGFVFAAACKDRNLFDALCKLAGSPAQGDVVNIMGYCMAYTDGALIATTQSIYDQCLKDGQLKDLPRSLKDTALKGTLLKGGLTVDFQAIAANPFLNGLKQNREVNTALGILKQLGILTASYENLQQGSAELTFKDADKNALEQLVSMGMSVAMGL